MLTLSDTRPSRHCQGLARRDFLGVGSLAMGGLGLSQMLSVRPALAAAGHPVRDKSVVLLFLQGGPPHIEMFDPKMSAPVEIHSCSGEVQTRIPGITFGGHFEKLSQMTDRFTILRSYRSNNSGHTYQKVASGGNATKATMGALYARVAGTNSPSSGMPTNVLVVPEAIEPGLKLRSNFETKALPTLTAAGDLGPNYVAFNPRGGGQLKDNMQLKLPRNRFDNRRLLLTGLDNLKRRFDDESLVDQTDKYQQQAFEVITRGVAAAFDLSQERPETIASYDTSHLFKNADVHRWYDMSRASNLLGKQMLMARRLCEAGCGFVTVSDCGWDFHSNKNSPKNLGGMNWLGPQVDHAVAAFLEDIHQRGLSEKIMLVVTGEMGRTPRKNKNGGRDHYGGLTSLLVAGGGVPGGQVIGQSDNHATKPISTPYSPRDLLATVLNTLFDAGEVRVTRGVPTELINLLEESKPIPGLVT